MERLNVHWLIVLFQMNMVDEILLYIFETCSLTAVSSTLKSISFLCNYFLPVTNPELVLNVSSFGG